MPTSPPVSPRRRASNARHSIADASRARDAPPVRSAPPTERRAFASSTQGTLVSVSHSARRSDASDAPRRATDVRGAKAARASVDEHAAAVRRRNSRGRCPLLAVRAAHAASREKRGDAPRKMRAPVASQATQRRSVVGYGARAFRSGRWAPAPAAERPLRPLIFLRGRKWSHGGGPATRSSGPAGRTAGLLRDEVKRIATLSGRRRCRCLTAAALAYRRQAPRLLLVFLARSSSTCCSAGA